MGGMSLVFLGVFAVCFSACKTPDYQAAHDEWIVQRRSALLAPDGWISLVGLFWLEPGANFFGSGELNDLRFPPQAAPTLGTFYLEGATVRVEVPTDVDVQMNGEKLISATLTEREDQGLMKYGPLEWFLIERAGQYGIRVRDTSLLTRVLLEAIPRYDFAKSWRKEARFIPFDTPKSRIMRNVLEMDIAVEVPGVLEFSHAGSKHQLEVMDGGPEDFFIVFSDETTGSVTYGGGRYIYVSRPDEQGKTTIDFNRAYNPPCVFTDFATCLLPNPENALGFVVDAGEKNKGH